MKLRAYKMKLKPGYEQEYKKRHDAIWPELAELLTKSGISDYSIFLDKETLTLFAVHKLSDDNTANTIASEAVMRKWWNYMADIMQCNPDNSPVESELIEVFHMD